MKKATLAQGRKLLELVDELGISETQMQNVLESGLLPHFLQADLKAVIRTDVITALAPVYKIRVAAIPDPDGLLKIGKFVSPVPPVRQLVLAECSAGQDRMVTFKVIRLMARYEEDLFEEVERHLDWRLPTIGEALALFSASPDVGRGFTVVACPGPKRQVLVLWYDSNRPEVRHLELDGHPRSRQADRLYTYLWDSKCRFVVVTGDELCTD